MSRSQLEDLNKEQYQYMPTYHTGRAARSIEDILAPLGFKYDPEFDETGSVKRAKEGQSYEEATDLLRDLLGNAGFTLEGEQEK